MDRHLAWIAASLLTPAMFACTTNRTPTPPSPPVLPNVAIHIEGGPIYTGPLYSHVGGYIPPGSQHAHAFTMDDAVVDRATDLALKGTQGLSDRVAIGPIRQIGTLAELREVHCNGLCLRVPVIDYEAGDVHSMVVELMGGKVVSDTIHPGLGIAPGEQEVRELFGTALTDPAIASQIADDRYTVSSADKTFTAPQTSCSSDMNPHHRCVIGFIYTPATILVVFVDLTDRTVVDWQSRDASA